MYGAILGDIIGQPFEFDRRNKTKDFPLFRQHPTFTDDSVMTIAICDKVYVILFDSPENRCRSMEQKLIHFLQYQQGASR